MKRTVTIFILLMSVMVSFSAINSFVIPPAFAEEIQYNCPMHPHYISQEAGTCPICGMDLVAIAQEENDDEEMVDEKTDSSFSDSSSNGEASSGDGKQIILYWQAPMNPNYRSDKPGKSPMGMDLVPVYGAKDGGSQDGNKRNSKKKGGVKVTISPETIQNIGVRTEKAEAARFGTDVRSYGLVTENIRIQYDISSRVSGWIEELKITAVGDEVKKGELLFTLYSPDLVSAQQDYVAAIIAGAEGRILSSAKRLESLGVQKQVLEQIKESRNRLENVPFYAESSGIISMLEIRQGTYVKSGMQLAMIQDYSSVWINVSVAEKDLIFLSKNMKAEVAFPNLSNEIRTARIDYIYPTIDKASRTGQVRLVLDNSDGSLRPGSYADVSFETTSVKRLSIPSEAVLRASDGSHVVVALGNGRFQARMVKTGVYNRGRVQILSGLKEGDDVVVSSQFMIDSESSLRESFRKMQKMQAPLAKLKITKKQFAMIDHLIDASLYIHESLVDGYEIDPKMLAPALKLHDELTSEFRGTKLQFILEETEKAIMEAKESITDSETRIALADMMIALKPWLQKGKPNHYEAIGLHIFSDDETGNLWIQQDSEPKNPYSDGMSVPVEWPANAGNTNAGDNNAK